MTTNALYHVYDTMEHPPYKMPSQKMKTVDQLYNHTKTLYIGQHTIAP